ncbi:ankyrin repeat domain-containing protein [Thermodesulfobacteriota bacterium]
MIKQCLGIIMTRVWPTVLLLLVLPGLGSAAPNDSLDEQLITAAARGNVQRVKSLLEEGADVNAAPRDGWTPLMAAASGHLWATGLVFSGKDKKTFLNPPERKFLTSAERTPPKGRYAVAKLLLEKGAKVKARDKHGRSALLVGAEAGHVEIARLLLSKGADVNAADEEGNTPLMEAAGSVHPEVVKLLLERGASVNAKDKNDENALSRAARLNNFAASVLMQQSLRNNAGTSGETIRYDESLIPVIWRRHPKVVELLKASGAEFTLLSAAMLGETDEARRLVRAGSDVNGKAGYYSQTPLMGAAAYGHTVIAELLVKNGAAIESRDYHGRTALHLAAGRGHIDVAKLLLDRGAAIEARDNRGETPLIEAARTAKRSMIELLLKRGADINAKDNWGHTALVEAADSRDTDLVRLLLDNGSDIEGKTGFSALWRAASFKRSGVIELLKAYGVEVTLSAAAMIGDKRAVERLIEKGADVNARMEYGRTPLMRASEMGHADVAQLLLEKGARVHSKANDGMTALNLARRSVSSRAVIELLLSHGARE